MLFAKDLQNTKSLKDKFSTSSIALKMKTKIKACIPRAQKRKTRRKRAREKKDREKKKENREKEKRMAPKTVTIRMKTRIEKINSKLPRLNRIGGKGRRVSLEF
jgi:hypothetical protein